MLSVYYGFERAIGIRGLRHGDFGVCGGRARRDCSKSDRSF